MNTIYELEVPPSISRAASSSPSPRRLPPVPRSARPVSHARPLPSVPRPLTCKKCGTCITSHNVLLPPSAFPADSRGFRGFSGRAKLFTETYNVKLSRPSVQLMVTGAHTMQEITCLGCSIYLGWKILRAHEPTESWKEGTCLLEMESLNKHAESFFSSPRRLPDSPPASDSDSDSWHS